MLVRPPLSFSPSGISELSPAALKVFALHFGIPIPSSRKKVSPLPAVGDHSQRTSALREGEALPKADIVLRKVA